MLATALRAVPLRLRTRQIRRDGPWHMRSIQELREQHGWPSGQRRAKPAANLESGNYSPGNAADCQSNGLKQAASACLQYEVPS